MPTIYVYLPDEAVDVWRPVPAEHIRGDIYRITGELPDDTERWEFGPGELVRCRMKQFFDGPALVAHEAAAPSP